jgi:TPR repeat protein
MRAIVSKMVFALALASAGTLCVSAVRAQDSDPGDMQMSLCDALAAHPLDRDRPKGFPGVDVIAKADANAAVDACNAASEARALSDPNMRRLAFELGRALEAQGKMAEALESYRWASTKGSTMAKVTLALIELEGKGTPKKPEKAIALLQEAAGDGDVTAMVNLGSIYSGGVGTQVDLDEAKRWYELAAGEDNGEAMFQLGLMARDGDAGRKDDKAAKGWFEKASAQHRADAMVELGHFAEDGRAGPKDLAKALQFYEKAAALGSADGKTNAARLRCAVALKDAEQILFGRFCAPMKRSSATASSMCSATSANAPGCAAL